MTPLFHAVLFTNVAAVRAALRARPNLEAAGPMGVPVIFAAVEEFYSEATGTGDYEGKPPRRAGTKTLEVLELLLRAGANPNVVFRNPKTGNVLSPLSTIAGEGLIEGVRLFLDTAVGLDVMVPTAEEATLRCMWPLQLAIDRGHSAVARLLMAHPSFDAGRDPRALIAAAERGNVAILEALLAAPGGARVVDAPHPDPRIASPALHAAAYSGHACVEPLLAAGANALSVRGGGAPPPGIDPDDPSFNLTPMGCVIATGAEPTLIEALVARGARRPRIVERGGAFFFTARDGRESRIVDMRGMRTGAGVLDMRAQGKVSRASAAGLVDERLDQYLCGACSEPPKFGAALLRCGRCLSAHYCNTGCQRAAWPTHKVSCKKPGEDA